MAWSTKKLLRLNKALPLAMFTVSVIIQAWRREYQYDKNRLFNTMTAGGSLLMEEPPVIYLKIK